MNARMHGDRAAEAKAITRARSPELAALLLDSHRTLTGRDLLPLAMTPAEAAAALYRAPFVVLAHDLGEDPRFIYANEAAQRRFALALDAIIGMPSRYSAEAPARDERQRLLDQVAAHGYIADYRGVRVDSQGRRFEIHRATVWNLVDSGGRVVGQAAAFAEWTDLPAAE